MRYDSLDGLRGLFLILMMEAHANSVLGSGLGRFDHHDLSWADAAHGFVFLSGLVAGIVYTRRLLREGDTSTSRSLRHRTLTIYGYHAALVLILLALALAALATGRTVPILRPVMDHPVLVTGLGLLLAGDVDFLDVLPMYVVLMAAAPPLLRALHCGHGPWLLAGSALLWLGAQTGITAPLLDGIEARLSPDGPSLALGSYFNLLGWQVLFVVGLALGHFAATGHDPARRLLRPEGERLAWVAMGLIAVLAAWRVADHLGLEAWNPLATHPGLADKSTNGPLMIVSFTANTFVAAWLLVAGPRARSRPLRVLARGFCVLATWPPLAFLGRHSLQAFATHVLYVYTLAYAFAGQRPGPVLAAALLLTSPAPLFAAAWLHEHRRTRSARPA